MNINGFPYLFDESVNQACIRQVDRLSIINKLSVDTSKHNYTIIDIIVDDTDDEVGNRIKCNELLDIFKSNGLVLDKNIDVIRKALLVQINYQIENDRTGRVLHEYKIESIISNIDDYTTINPDVAGDTIVLTNFHGLINTTIPDNVHGRNVTCRIIDIKFFFLAVSNFNGVEYDRSDLRDNIFNQCDLVDNTTISSNMLHSDKFYNFDDGCYYITPNYPKIESKDTKVLMIPAGSVDVDKVISVNIAHKFLFNISVWKNSVIFVGDVTNIANAIGIDTFIADITTDDADGGTY
jgi:hypothetical protein